eukprot:366826-Pyramimonas_sp.AAC.2
MDVKGNIVNVTGNAMDVKGNIVDVKGNGMDVKGNISLTPFVRFLVNEATSGTRCTLHCAALHHARKVGTVQGKTKKMSHRN